MNAILQDSSELEGDGGVTEVPSALRGLRCSSNRRGEGVPLRRDDVSGLVLMVVCSWIESSDQCLYADKHGPDTANTSTHHLQTSLCFPITPSHSTSNQKSSLRYPSV